MLARLSLFDPPYPPCLPDLAIIFFVMFYHLFYTRPRAGLRPAGPRWDRRKGTVLMGTLFTPRFAPTALSSKGTDCSSEDLQKLVKTYSWVSDTIFAILFLVCIFGFLDIYQCNVTEKTEKQNVTPARPRRLNMMKFCGNCDTLHRSGFKCPSCHPAKPVTP